MASNPISFPPLRNDTLVTDQRGHVTIEAHKSLLQLYNGTQLIPYSSAAGALTLVVPLANLNQNVELTYVKTSADANAATLKVQGNNLINGKATFALPTAQYSATKIRSDGNKSWYVSN